MENLVDARGLGCPQPVICTKKALEKLEAGTLTTIVDNEIAKENVVRYASKLDYPVEIEKKEQAYYIKIKKDLGMVEVLDNQKSSVILFQSEYLGRGSEELGRVLCKSFFFTLVETEPLPRSIIFINSGVKLTCEGSHVLEQIITLEKKGVEILSCGTCLDYFQIKNRLCVGEISNMYTIVEKLMTSTIISL